MDDEKLVRSVAAQLLSVLGHEAALAEDGAEAIAQYAAAKAAGRPFEVVILDLTIRGGMGGEETLRRLREIDPAVKAVVSSGYSDDEIAASFRDHGFCAFLKKPYNIGELSRVLAETLA
jgi:CheY-like chemotaxis protein